MFLELCCQVKLTFTNSVSVRKLCLACEKLLLFPNLKLCTGKFNHWLDKCACVTEVREMCLTWWLPLFKTEIRALFSFTGSSVPGLNMGERQFTCP